MEFAIQINVGESPQEALERAVEDLKRHERGETYVVNQLGVLNWQEFYALFSPAGLLQIESFVESQNGEIEENMCEWQPKDSKAIMTESVVSMFGKSLGVFLPTTLCEGRNIVVGTPVKIVECGSDLVITLRGNENIVPSLKEMLDQCDLNSEHHPDSVTFESSPAVGKEDV